MERGWDYPMASKRAKPSDSPREMSSERSSDEEMAIPKDAQKDWLMERSWDHLMASKRVQLSALPKEMSLEWSSDEPTALKKEERSD